MAVLVGGSVLDDAKEMMGVDMHTHREREGIHKVDLIPQETIQETESEGRNNGDKGRQEWLQEHMMNNEQVAHNIHLSHTHIHLVSLSSLSRLSLFLVFPIH